MNIPVTLVTQNANQDDLSETDYREMYQELRDNYSLRDFVALAKSAKSIAYWSKYERGESGIGRAERNELRRAVGLPGLVPTVADAMADVDEDAEVLAIGDKPKNRVFLATKGESLTIYANGSVTASLDRVTSVTRKRKRYRPDMTQAQYARWRAMSKDERDRVLGI